MRSLFLSGILAISLLISPVSLQGDSSSSTRDTMTEDQLVAFFEQQPIGTPLELTLEKGKVVDGIFSSYDDYYGTVWLVPHEGQGLLKQKGFRISGIKKAGPWVRPVLVNSDQAGSSGSITVNDIDPKEN